MRNKDEFEDEDPDIQDETSPFNIKGNIISLIRTTQRNYIDLTNIADNKAHILISINSLMLTVLIPIILANYQIIIEKHFYFPLTFFAFTCLFTIIFSAMVLTPFSGNKQKSEIEKKTTKRSPFFFTNYADLTIDEYRSLFQKTLSTKDAVNQIIVSDLYYFGINLASKYKLVKRAYKVFNTGMILSFISFILAVII